MYLIIDVQKYRNIKTTTNGKKRKQERNEQNTKTKTLDGRQPPMNYVWTISAEKVFFLALFIVYGNHSGGNVYKNIMN